MNTVEFREAASARPEYDQPCGSSHIGSALSIADIMAVLYGQVLNIDPQNPKPDGIVLFLSKGPCGRNRLWLLAERGLCRWKADYALSEWLGSMMCHTKESQVELSTGLLKACRWVPVWPMR